VSLALALAACGPDPAAPATPVALQIAYLGGLTVPASLTIEGVGNGQALIAQTLRRDRAVLASAVTARWTSGDAGVAVVRDSFFTYRVQPQAGVMVWSRGPGQTTIEATVDAGGGRTLRASLPVTVTAAPRP
jgi:hypothetical protein